MKYTNKYNLPDRVIRVIQGKYKNKRPDPFRMSVTDLINEPLIRTLQIEKWDELVRDYSDFLTMVQGTALHDRYEMLADEDDDCETKLENPVGNFILVGKADNKRDDYILDVKQTAVYNPLYKIPDWTAQGNVYVWQRRVRGEEINRILIDVWYRNWQEKNKHWRNYPPIPYEELSLKVWTQQEQDDYINSQVEFHTMASHDECSEQQKGIRWEAFKNKNKTNCKVGSSFDEVQKWVNKQDKKDAYRIEKSPPKFCIKYCKSRSICPFNKGEMK
jgi:hypothetical protein